MRDNKRSIRTKLFKPRPGDEILLGDEKIIILWVSKTKVEAYRRMRGKRGRIRTYDMDWWIDFWEKSPHLDKRNTR